MDKYETAIANITNRAEHTLKTVISAETAQLAIEALQSQGRSCLLRKLPNCLKKR